MQFKARAPRLVFRQKRNLTVNGFSNTLFIKKLYTIIHVLPTVMAEVVLPTMLLVPASACGSSYISTYAHSMPLDIKHNDDNAISLGGPSLSV